jgi:mannosyltransferase OCH1-like enzyme
MHSNPSIAFITAVSRHTDASQSLHACRYEYKLWTDESARVFIAERFPELLPTWDAYPYVIQQADVIRRASLPNQFAWNRL